MRRVLTFILVIVMAVSFMACGGKDNTGTDGTDPTGQPAGDTPAPTGIPVTDTGAVATVDSIPIDSIVNLFIDMTDLNLGSTCVATELNQENAGFMIGYEGFKGDYETAYSLAPMMNASPFVLAVFRLNEGDDAEAFASDLKTHANPNKWICVTADTVETRVSGQTVLFFMSATEYAEPLLKAFDEMCRPDFVVEEHLTDPLNDLSMKELYDKLYEIFSIDAYGFMDNKELGTVNSETGYGLSAVDTERIKDSLFDEGYEGKSDEDEEKAYMLGMLRLEAGAAPEETAAIIKSGLDTTLLKGGKAETVIVYGSDVVIVYAATGSFGISAASLEIVLNSEYRMKTLFSGTM